MKLLSFTVKLTPRPMDEAGVVHNWKPILAFDGKIWRSVYNDGTIGRWYNLHGVEVSHYDFRCWIPQLPPGPDLRNNESQD